MRMMVVSNTGTAFTRHIMVQSFLCIIQSYSLDNFGIMALGGSLYIHPRLSSILHAYHTGYVYDYGSWVA